MQFASSRYSSQPQIGFTRRRAIALGLALAVHALLLFLLLRQVYQADMSQPMGARMSTFNVAPGPEATATEQAKKQERKSKPASPRQPKAAAVAPPEIDRPKVDAAPAPLAMILLSRRDFAASDIGKMPSRPGKQADGESGDSADAGASRPIGGGPAGQSLADADWQKRPTNAELSTYMPKGARVDGWGLIACQTIERYGVDNCHELGESPRGSGLARAVRLAAWQFKVRPPRINGRAQMGAWVRIRIDYTQSLIKER
ncbi:hypothetical protein [Sphingobium boeckii]|uniref:Protein TonB n=1 Tax=Sphingobium boeckii TaxID=1082345 RepID=A0A7W9AI47_9SPHN|nr:hypothetical protein [Sphingobium boeckii]MBB5686008.1 protein TonB [Sphingobium boeckii]